VVIDPKGRKGRKVFRRQGGGGPPGLGGGGPHMRGFSPPIKATRHFADLGSRTGGNGHPPQQKKKPQLAEKGGADDFFSRLRFLGKRETHFFLRGLGARGEREKPVFFLLSAPTNIHWPFGPGATNVLERNFRVGSGCLRGGGLREDLVQDLRPPRIGPGGGRGAPLDVEKKPPIQPIPLDPGAQRVVLRPPGPPNKKNFWDPQNQTNHPHLQKKTREGNFFIGKPPRGDSGGSVDSHKRILGDLLGGRQKKSRSGTRRDGGGNAGNGKKQTQGDIGDQGRWEPPPKKGNLRKQGGRPVGGGAIGVQIFGEIFWKMRLGEILTSAD